METTGSHATVSEVGIIDPDIVTETDLTPEDVDTLFTADRDIAAELLGALSYARKAERIRREILTWGTVDATFLDELKSVVDAGGSIDDYSRYGQNEMQLFFLRTYVHYLRLSRVY